MAQKEI
jgi:serine/threonine-protein kinase ULK/ATG1